MLLDVTDATFEAEVIERSTITPVVVDLWAPWCGPCQTLGPIIEAAVSSHEGAVVLAKVNVDENPGISQAFSVQGIPAVYALKDKAVVDHFVGAKGSAEVSAFVDALVPASGDTQLDALIEAGDEASLVAALELQSDHPPAVLGLAEIYAGSNRADDALALLERIPDGPDARRIAAIARAGGPGSASDHAAEIEGLLPRVKGDDDARQRIVDLLELMGPDDSRTAELRRRLTTALF